MLRFKDRCEKYLTLNHIAVVTVDSIPLTKEAEMPILSVIPDDTIDLDKGYYHFVYVLLHFNNEEGVDRQEDQVYTKEYLNG